MGKSGNPKASGWLSSIVAIVLALLLLHTFPLMGNWIDKQRSGEGKYDFDADLCYDLDDVKDLNNNYVYDGPKDTYGTGALMWFYDAPASFYALSKMSLMSFPLNGTIDGYGVGTTTPDPANLPEENHPNFLFINTNLTKKIFIDNDVSRMDIYFDVGGVPYTQMGFAMARLDDGEIKDIVISKQISLKNTTKLTLNVENFLELNNYALTDKIVFKFSALIDTPIPSGSYVVFDLQLYNIEEIKTPTLTRLAGWVALMNTGILILVFIALPQIQVLGKFNGIGKRLEKI